jgi:hypothetical protein
MRKARAQARAFCLSDNHCSAEVSLSEHRTGGPREKPKRRLQEPLKEPLEEPLIERSCGSKLDPRVAQFTKIPHSADDLPQSLCLVPA